MNDDEFKVPSYIKIILDYMYTTCTGRWKHEVNENIKTQLQRRNNKKYLAMN